MPGLRYGSAAEAGLSQARLDRARELAKSWVEDGTHPALEVLVARHGVVALHEAYGAFSSAADARPVERGDLMPIASMIKPVTAAALLCLVEDGLVGLTRPVQEYIPEFNGAGREAVCVHHLLTHTSGLYEDVVVTVQQAFERLGSPRRFEGVHHIVDGLLQLACEHPLVDEPGKTMRYDTLNYELIGEIIRRVSGQPIQAFATERIFAPLVMHDTYYALPKDAAGRVVTAVLKAAFSPETPLINIGSASGIGIYSTPLDMARFLQMVLDRGRGPLGQVLHPSSVSAMTVNQIPGIAGGFPQEWHDEASWSFGWIVANHERWSGFPVLPRGAIGHSGAAGTLMWADPSSGVLGVYMSFADVRGFDEDGSSTRDADDPLIIEWNADLFVNVINTAVED